MKKERGARVPRGAALPVGARLMEVAAGTYCQRAPSNWVWL
jgi:hypothetical protein